MDATWGWGALGLVLLGVEMATGTFYVVWFGIAALCVAAVILVFPNMSPTLQFVMFAGLSMGLLTIWKLNYKKTETHSRVGQSQGEEIGRTGIVTSNVSPTQTGKISFVQGVMGSREWTAVSDEVIEAGAQASVIAVEGNLLRIKKTHLT